MKIYSQQTQENLSQRVQELQRKEQQLQQAQQKFLDQEIDLYQRSSALYAQEAELHRRSAASYAKEAELYRRSSELYAGEAYRRQRENMPPSEQESALVRELAAKEEELRQLTSRLEVAETLIAAMEQTLSWKVTTPLRRFRNSARVLRFCLVCKRCLQKINAVHFPLPEAVQHP